MEFLKEQIIDLMKAGFTNEQANAILLVALRVADKCCDLRDGKQEEENG